MVSRETFAIEQIEILHGPNATIGGRGTTGGAVKIVNKAPGETDFTEVDATLGTDKAKRLTTDLNVVISPKAALRVNGLVHDAEVAGRNEVFDERLGASAVATVRPTDQLALTVDYYYLDTDTMPDWGHPYDVDNNRPYQVDRDNFYGVLARDFHETSARIGTARLQYEFSDTLQLDAQMRHGVTNNAYIVSKPGFSTRSCPDLMEAYVCSSTARRDQENRYVGGQANVIKDIELAGVGHTFVIGVESSAEDIENLPPGASPNGVPLSLYNPDPHVPWDGSITPGRTVRSNSVDTRAFYVLDSVRLGERWRISGGLRHDSFETEASSGPTDYSEAHSSLRNDSDFVNWNFGVVYKPAPDGSIYAAASTSSNPPGEQVDAGTAASYGGLAEGFQDYAPERNTNYELGVKWDLMDQRLNIAAAFFHTTKEDQFLSGGSRSAPIYSNDGESQSRGLSLSVSGNVTDDLSLVGGFTYLDTEVTKQPLNPDAVGKKLANVPEFSASLMARYQVNSALAVGGTMYHQSEVHGGTLDAGTTRIPDYFRFDVTAEYRIAEALSARLNVLNAGDETYYDTLYRSPAPYGRLS